MEKLRWLVTYLNLWRILPAYIFHRTNRFHTKCRLDLDSWISYAHGLNNHGRVWQLGYLLVHQRECRNIFLNRLHRNILMYAIARVLFPPMETCYINMPPEKIGGGFSLQHGFSTIVAAEQIGENCRVLQQVTVGYNETAAPVIGDRVMISAGAIVIGGITVGDGACIGAGAVVVHDVPADTTVVGVPAKPVGGKRSG